MGTKNSPGAFDCYEKAEPDEPMFILLGRDASAPALVEHWAMHRELAILGGHKPDTDRAMVEEAKHYAREMRAYRARRHPKDKPAESLLYRPCLEPPYFADEGTDDWDQETGKPGIDGFSQAIQMWSMFQGRDTTVEEAASVFNVPVEMVRQAVLDHPWMLLEGEDGNIIGHDGE